MQIRFDERHANRRVIVEDAAIGELAEERSEVHAAHRSQNARRNGSLAVKAGVLANVKANGHVGLGQCIPKGPAYRRRRTGSSRRSEIRQAARVTAPP